MAAEQKLLVLKQCEDRSDMFTLIDQVLTFDPPVFGVHGINNPVDVVWFGCQSFCSF